MPSFFVRTKFGLALLGLLLTFLGIAILVNPGGATIFVTTLVGWATAIAGGASLITGLVGRRSQQDGRGDLLFGGLQLVLGLLIVMMPGFFVSYLFVLLGIGVVITGMVDLGHANDVRKAGFSAWKLPMAFGALTLLAGVAMVFSPFVAASFVSSIAAVSLIFSGVTELYVAFML